MIKSLLPLLVLLAADSTLAMDRPNVILIVTDDQGYGDMSCHGNPWLRTPNLDRLRAESIRLEDYHVDPVCTPTRASLMTGRYSSRVGAWAVTEGRQLLKPDEVTMADVFSDSGYRTGMFGKWHLGDTWPYAPRFRGFQDVVRHLAGGIDEIGNPIGNDYFDDTLAINGLWAVNVVQAGRYSIRLSRFPDDAPQAMRATKAILRIGEHELERTLDGNETSVTFEMDLPKGRGLLQSWLSDKATGVRGAYFVQVERLND